MQRARRLVGFGSAGLQRLATSHCLLSPSRLFSSAPAIGTIASWASVDPYTVSQGAPLQLFNLVKGEWYSPDSGHEWIPDPMNGERFIKTPRTQPSEIQPFIDSLRSTPKSGLHNPLKNPERYLLYGEVSEKAANALCDPKVADFFVRCIMRVVPKSYDQAMGEVLVTRKFLENFAGDNVRFLARGFTVPGDHFGQQSTGYRWPYGPAGLITPFNFPLEIPALQLMGALFMGNKVLIKNAELTSMVIEQFIRLLHACGMPQEDVDLIHSHGQTMEAIIREDVFRVMQFTGSSGVAERLSEVTRGKVKIEDAGFDWKILGPDVHEVDHVAQTCDGDAYNCSGQKCSAQSILFMHENWEKNSNLLEKMEELAAKRNIRDMTIGPVLTWTTEAILEHIQKLLSIPGAYVLFGGKELTKHTIPKQYGAIEPTAVFVPLEKILETEDNFKLVTTEIFGPFQVVTTYSSDELGKVLGIFEKMGHHLTAAIVSNNIEFQQTVLANTVNGTTYTGIRARTTGAPQNHWFGPAGDPRGAGIGTREAIQLVWSCHREVISDYLV